jgi:hypothetical protein
MIVHKTDIMSLKAVKRLLNENILMEVNDTIIMIALMIAAAAAAVVVVQMRMALS